MNHNLLYCILCSILALIFAAIFPHEPIFQSLYLPLFALTIIFVSNVLFLSYLIDGSFNLCQLAPVF